MDKLSDIYKEYSSEERIEAIAETLLEGSIRLWEDKCPNGKTT